MKQIGDIISELEQIQMTDTGRNSWITFDDGTDTSGIYTSQGSPEGSVTADIGSLCLDTTNGELYKKTTDTVNTGWEAVGSGTTLSDGEIATGITSGDPVAQAMTWLPVNFGYVFNMSWSLSAGVLTVAGYDGTALSASNPAYALIKSNATSGQYALHKFTANQTLTVSDMTGNTLGTSASIAWSSSGLPLYIGIMADSNDANPEFVVTRIPHLHISPSSDSDIGDPSAANADTERSVFAFNDITEADYTAKNLVIIGGIAVTKDNSEVYTITTASSAYSGVGDFLEDTTFGFPLSQNGAATGKYMANNGGTAPTFSISGYGYYISRYGKLRGEFRFSGDTATDGSGAVSAELALPLEMHNFAISNTKPLGVAYVSSAGAGIRPSLIYGQNTTNRNKVRFTELTTGSDVQNGDFTNGGRNLWGFYEYVIYNGGS